MMVMGQIIQEISDNSARFRLLYIEDERRLADQFKGVMEGLGYDVTFATTGGEGLEEYVHQPFDIVVANHRLPDLPGIDIARQLLARNPDLPVLMVAERYNGKIAAEASMIGVRHYLVKNGLPAFYTKVIPETIGKLARQIGETRARISTENALRESEAWSNSIISALGQLGEGLFVVSGDYKVEHMNEVLIEWFGDQTGKTCYSAVVGLDAPCGHCRLKEVTTEGRTVYYEVPAPGGRTFSVGATPIRANNGEIHKLEVISNITARKQMEEDLHVALAEAKQASQAKSEFLATMSHELRTPLNAIIGFSEMFMDQLFGKLGSEKYLDYAKDISSSSEHLLLLVNDILDLSAIEAGEYPLSKETLVIADVLEERQRIIELAATKKNIKLEFDVSRGLAPIYADRRALQQIFLNLLSNGVKYTANGGKLSVRVTAEDKHHHICVRDTGKGIRQDMLQKITEPFTKIESDPYRTEEGTGLGLAIVQKLVTLHNGELSIESEFGKGTAVYVKLPTDNP
jgi:signal transduction histidine kinase/ActR/RegA family two-component response regulator